MKSSQAAILVLTMILSFPGHSREGYALSKFDSIYNYCQFDNHTDTSKQYETLANAGARESVIAKTSVLNQFSFKNEKPERLQIFKNLVEKRNDFGGLDFLKQFNFIPEMNRSCSTVECFLKSIFSQNTGIAQFYLNYKFNLNASHYVYNNSAEPNMEELNSWLKALEYVPKHLTKFKYNQKLSKFVRGVYGRTYANATMEFFDGWSRMPEEFRIYTAIHEFSHNWNFSEDLDLDKTDEWLRLSGWQKNETNAWNKKNLETFVSEYSLVSPSEDYAETSVAYRFNPETLKRVSMPKYNFMKNIVYGELEFSVNTCAQKSMQPEIFKTEFRKHKDLIFKNIESLILNNCFDDLLSYSGGASPSLKKCIQQNIIKEISYSKYGLRLVPLTLYNQADQEYLMASDESQSQLPRYLKLFRKNFSQYCPALNSGSRPSYAYVQGDLANRLDPYYAKTFLKKTPLDRYDQIIKILKDVCP